MHWTRRRSPWGALLAILLAGSGCSTRPAEESAGAQPAEPVIQWPQATSVLDGTNVIALTQAEHMSLDPARIAGNLRAEQGGAEILLVVRAGPDFLEVERTFREPELEPETKRYRLNVMSMEGAADPRAGVYLRQSKDGVLLLEERPGVDTIPTDVWIRYVRE